VSFHALLLELAQRTMQHMKNRLFAPSRKMSLLCSLLLLLDAPRTLMAEPTPAAVSAFNAYTRCVEGRLARQHRSPNTFLAPTPDPNTLDTRLHHGDLILEQITAAPNADLSGALLHHWRGTAFAHGATPADFERLMRDFNAYPQHFAPQVLQARVLAQSADHMQASMRIRQHHVITVVMDTTYDVTFGHLDVQHGYSISRSNRISEIDDPGTASEHALTPAEEHGFLWRLNTYWSYEQRDGGLYLQIEAVSLTRSIPHGLAWAIRPYVESIPRESLEFTLRSACNALKKVSKHE
jgi:hypothetical protein